MLLTQAVAHLDREQLGLLYFLTIAIEISWPTS